MKLVEAGFLNIGKVICVFVLLGVLVRKECILYLFLHMFLFLCFWNIKNACILYFTVIRWLRLHLCQTKKYGITYVLYFSYLAEQTGVKLVEAGF